MSSGDVPVLFVQWEELVGWLLQRTTRFPRSVRFTLTERVDNLALNIFERLIEARYSRNRLPLLRQINLDLEKLRLLLRLCHTQAHLDHGSFVHVMERIDEVGRMVGGWQRQQQPPSALEASV